MCSQFFRHTTRHVCGKSDHVRPGSKARWICSRGCSRQELRTAPACRGPRTSSGRESQRAADRALPQSTRRHPLGPRKPPQARPTIRRAAHHRRQNAGPSPVLAQPEDGPRVIAFGLGITIGAKGGTTTIVRDRHERAARSCRAKGCRHAHLSLCRSNFATGYQPSPGGAAFLVMNRTNNSSNHANVLWWRY